MLGLGNGKERPVYFNLGVGVQRIKPRLSIQPTIKIIFSPQFVGLKTQAMRQSETPFCLSNAETK